MWAKETSSHLQVSQLEIHCQFESSLEISFYAMEIPWQTDNTGKICVENF